MELAIQFECPECGEVDNLKPNCENCGHSYVCENCGFNDMERRNNCPRCKFCTGCNQPYETCDIGRWFAEKEKEEAAKPDFTCCVSCGEALYTQDDVTTHVCRVVEPYEPEF